MLAAVLTSLVNPLSSSCLCPVCMKVIMPIPIYSFFLFLFFSQSESHISEEVCNSRKKAGTSVRKLMPIVAV